MDQQFEYKLTRPKPHESMCSSVSLDVKCLTDFQNYVLNVLDFQQIRVAYLYGHINDYVEPKELPKETFDEKGKLIPINKSPSVQVEFIYEPPQSNTDTEMHLEDDPMEETVEELATALGCVKVGWIFSHPLREEKFNFSGTCTLYLLYNIILLVFFI